MNYEIGDTVVHSIHGLGKIIAIDEMQMAEMMQPYYVVEGRLFKVWVPVEEASVGSIRFPTEKIQFNNLFDILRTPGDGLPDPYYQRKMELRKRMQSRTMIGLCHVIRDLTDRSQQHVLNQNDSTALLHAEEYLLDEWVLSLGTKRSTAFRELEVLLRGKGNHSPAE